MTALPPQLDADLIWAEYFGEARKAPALFLDRDGVIVEEVHYLHAVDKVSFIPGAFETIRWARAQGWHVVIITNQAGIGRGVFEWPDYVAVHDHILSELRAAEAPVDAVMACPFIADGVEPFAHPDHPARKPNPGMLLKAAAALHCDLSQSWIVGDKKSDIVAGQNANIAGGILVATGYGVDEEANVQELAKQNYQIIQATSIADVPSLINEAV